MKMRKARHAIVETIGAHAKDVPRSTLERSVLDQKELSVQILGRCKETQTGHSCVQSKEFHALPSFEGN